MTLFFTPQADHQAVDMDSWWREHRPGARDLFARELAEARELIVGAPTAGTMYSTRNGKSFRRVLMPKTKNHVYFEVDEGLMRTESMTPQRLAGVVPGECGA